MNRREMLQRLRAEPATWDVLVIGGGATGLGVAVDAAARGYRAALIEQGDFAQATSSRSTKLIHGGLRYLQQGNFALVRESLRERGRLLQNAPHLVRRLPFIVPNHLWWERSVYGAGLKLYDRLAGGLSLGASRHLSRTETLARLPTIETSRLRGGILYYDGQFDDARLAITLARTVADLGGLALNYVKAGTLLKQNGRLCGVLAHDLETGHEFELRARAIVNATGVFADSFRRLDDSAAPGLLALSQGAHIVLDKSFLPGDCALLMPHIAAGRVFFAIPWHGHTLIGTTETPVAQAKNEPRPLQQEIEFLLSLAAGCLTRKPGPADILSAFAGLRPLLKADTDKPTSALSRSHCVVVSPSGLVTITGGKWTTYRQMAEDAVNRAAELGGLPTRPSPTSHLKLHGWQEAEEQAALFRCYGSDANAVRGLCTGDDALPLHPRLPYCAGQVRWAVRHEMARTLEDVLSRRLRALPLDARAAIEMSLRVAEIVAEELGRDADWKTRQLTAFNALAKGYLVT